MIRKAEAQDAAAVTALLAPPAGAPADPEVLRAVFFDHLSYDDVRVLVAQERDELVGTVTVWFRPRLGWPTPVAWLTDLVASPGEASSAVARALFQAGVVEARRRGCHELLLHSADDHDGLEDAGRLHRLPLG